MKYLSLCLFLLAGCITSNEERAVTPKSFPPQEKTVFFSFESYKSGGILAVTNGDHVYVRKQSENSVSWEGYITFTGNLHWAFYGLENGQKTNEEFGVNKSCNGDTILVRVNLR